MYGGTERIVSYLTKELVKLGHQVTLFASGDSITTANLVSCAVRQHAEEFDILHFHIDHFHFPVFRNIAEKTVTTLHGRQDLPDNRALYFGFDDLPLVSISDDQRRPIPNANYGATMSRTSEELIAPEFSS
jgi:hypothetical protein